MNIFELIKAHRKNSQELIRAIEQEDIAAIERLDKVLVSEFNLILDFNVTTNDALIEKVEYLLDQLLSDDQKTPLTNNVSGQIIKDIASFIER